MRGVETRIQEIRHKIFTEVARMAYHTEWPVKERMEELPYKIIPGETGNFRNDVFLERAIVGERLRLAMGLPNRSAAEHAPVSDGIEAADQADRRSEETGGVGLLGLIDADVRQLNAPGLPLPHMGWNRVFPKFESPQAKLLFKNIEPGEWFYFVHSFAMPDGPAAIASCTYGEPFAAAAASENFMGVQFHPERSGKAGARLLANFLGAAA